MIYMAFILSNAGLSKFIAFSFQPNLLNTVDLDMHQKIPICPKLMLKGTQNECLSINIPFYILEWFYDDVITSIVHVCSFRFYLTKINSFQEKALCQWMKTFNIIDVLMYVFLKSANRSLLLDLNDRHKCWPSHSVICTWCVALNMKNAHIVYYSSTVVHILVHTIFMN